MAFIVKRPENPLPWIVDWREPETKTSRWKSFATKREADEFRDTINTDLRHGT